ncbi:MAG: AAA family ATPase [Candidatus Eisenbacteria bacterium]
MRRAVSSPRRCAASLLGGAPRRDRESASRRFNILLQVFEDGMLTDSLKRKVSFRTRSSSSPPTSARARSAARASSATRPDVDVEYSAMKDTVMDEVKKVFNPEFLNRVDEIIVFRPRPGTHREDR